MGLGSILPAGSVVKVDIIVGDDKAARVLNRTSRSLDRTARSARRASAGMLRFRSVIATMTKALISMVAVLIAFNLLITLPQRLFQGFVTVLRAATKTVSEFEQRILALQAILASTVTFSADPLENFVRSGRVAAAVVETLALRANEMVISLEEATIVFQTLIASGAQKMVKNMEELVDLTVILGNAIAGITVGQQRQRQLAEETRSLMTGQLRSTSLLGRLLFKNSKEINAFNREMERTGMLSTEIEQRLIGFAMAARDFAMTFEGLTTTIQTFLQILAKRALGGIFDETEKKVSSFLTQIRDGIALFNVLAATLASSFRILSGAITGIITDDVGIKFNSAEDFLTTMIALVPVLTQSMLTLVFTFRSWTIALIAIVQLLRALVAGILFLVTAFIQLAKAIGGFLGVDLLGELEKLSLGSEGGSIQQQLEDAIRLTDEFFSSLSASDKAASLMNDFLAVTLTELARIKEEMKVIAALQETMLGDRSIDLTIVIENNKQLLKRGSLLRRELSTLTEIIRLSRTGQLSGIIGGLEPRTVSAAQERARAGVIERDIARRNAQLQLDRVKFSGARNPEQVEELKNQISQLDSEINALLAGIAALDSAFAQLAGTTIEQFAGALKDLLAGDFFKRFVDSFKEGGEELKLSLTDTILSIKDFINSAAFLASIGNGIALAFENMFRGIQGFGQTMKDFLASLIIALGQAVIVMGVAAVAAGILTLNAGLVARGLAAIAAGAAAIAAGVALGGGGGGGTGGGAGSEGSQATPTFTFDQEMVNVQQAFLEATDNLNNSASEFRLATGDLTSMSPGELVVRGNTEKGGAARVLATDLKKGSGISAGQDIARTLGGN